MMVLFIVLQLVIGWQVMIRISEILHEAFSDPNWMNKEDIRNE